MEVDSTARPPSRAVLLHLVSLRSPASRLERCPLAGYDAIRMRLRWKLLILLLAISLGPLAIAMRFGQAGTQRTADDLAAQVRDALLTDARQLLLQSVQDHARIMLREGSILAHNLRIQALEVEQALAKPPPTQFELHPAADLAREPGAATAPLDPSPAALGRLGYDLAPGTDHAAVADDLARLATVLPAFQAVRQSQADLIFWQYASLENGVDVFYPGCGVLPEDYDPRLRPWYQRAKQENTLVRNRLLVDASTHVTVLTMSIPVRRPDGQFAGVTAIDIRLQDVVNAAELPEQWRDRAELLMVYADLAGRKGPPALFVMARRGPPATPEPVPEPALEARLERITSRDLPELDHVLMDIAMGHAATRTLRYHNCACVWAYAPLPGTEAALLATLPYDVILEPALAADRRLRARIAEQTALVGGLMVGVVAVVLVLSLLASRHVTRPVGALVATAQRIARGDFETPTRVTTHDEIGALGAAVNAMLPQLRERLRMKEALSVAMEVQQSLLPQQAPHVPGLDVAGRSLYCDETGGDYYDFLELAQLGPHTLGIAVGDVSGHGIAAALLMATARALLRSRADEPGSLGELLSHMNRHLTAGTPVGKFMTLCYLLLDAEQRTVRWANAGHDPPIVYRPSDDGFEEWDGGGLPLGIEAGWEYEELGPHALVAGVVIVVGTDGIWEAQNDRNEMFGRERLREIVRANAGRSAAEIGAAITTAIDAFRAGHPQDDDITLVVVKVLPSASHDVPQGQACVPGDP